MIWPFRPTIHNMAPLRPLHNPGAPRCVPANRGRATEGGGAMRSARCLTLVMVAVGLLEVAAGARQAAHAAPAQPKQARLVVFESLNQPG